MLFATFVRGQRLSVFYAAFLPFESPRTEHEPEGQLLG